MNDVFLLDAAVLPADVTLGEAIPVEVPAVGGAGWFRPWLRPWRPPERQPEPEREPVSHHRYHSVRAHGSATVGMVVTGAIDWEAEELFVLDVLEVPVGR
jgi:hypothetical protein